MSATPATMPSAFFARGGDCRVRRTDGSDTEAGTTSPRCVGCYVLSLPLIVSLSCLITSLPNECSVSLMNSATVNLSLLMSMLCASQNCLRPHLTRAREGVMPAEQVFGWDISLPLQKSNVFFSSVGRFSSSSLVRANSAGDVTT